MIDESALKVWHQIADWCEEAYILLDKCYASGKTAPSGRGSIGVDDYIYSMELILDAKNSAQHVASIIRNSLKGELQ